MAMDMYAGQMNPGLISDYVQCNLMLSNKRPGRAAIARSVPSVAHRYARNNRNRVEQ